MHPPVLTLVDVSALVSHLYGFDKLLERRVMILSTSSSYFCSAFALVLKRLRENFLNHFTQNVPFLYPIKISENLWFSDVFRGYKTGTLALNGLIKSPTQKVCRFYPFVFLLAGLSPSTYKFSL